MMISVFGTAIANIFQRLLMRDDKSDPILFSIMFQITITIITFVFALEKGFKFPPLSIIWVNLLLGAFLYAYGVIFNFKAAKTTEASNLVIIGTLGPVTTIIFAVLLLREPFGISKLIGATLILLSIFILYKKRKIKFDQGFYYAAISAFLFGLAVINDTLVLRRYDAISYTPIIFLLPGIVMLMAYSKVLVKVKQFISQKGLVKNMFLLGFFYSIAAIGYFLAIEKGANISQIAPINRASIITTVILAAVFLKERDQLLKKFFSAILVTLGVLLLI